MAGLASRDLYKEYRLRLDARMVLDRYGIDNETEMPQPDGTTEILHSCLLDRVEPHHNHGDSNPSARCNLDKKLYNCYAYWGGDLIHLVMKMERKDSIAEILPVLAECLTGATVDTETLVARLRKLMADESVYRMDLPSYSPRVLERWAWYHPYLATRNVTEDAAACLQMGYDMETNRIVFPHFWEGRLVGWQKRAIPEGTPWPATVPGPTDGGRVPKYKNSSGFPKMDTLYNYDLSCMRMPPREIVVVESPMSVAVAHSLHLDQYFGIIATFGAKIGAAQIDALAKFDKVTVWMDADGAGWNAEKKLVRGLYQRTKVSVVRPQIGRDLGDFTFDKEALTMVDSAEPAALALARYNKEG